MGSSKFEGTQIMNLWTLFYKSINCQKLQIDNITCELPATSFSLGAGEWLFTIYTGVFGGWQHTEKRGHKKIDQKSAKRGL